MNRKEKLIKKFFTGKTHVTIDDCDRVLTDYGYELKKGSGSHRTYHKHNTRPITIVISKGTRYVKKTYVNIIVEKLKMEEEHGGRGKI